MWRNHTPQSFSGYRETQKFKVGPSINQQKPSIRFCVPLKNLIAVSSTFRKNTHTKTAHNQHKLRFPSLLTNVKPPPMDTEDEVWLSITRPRAGSRQLPEAILLRHGPRELRWCWDDDEIFGWFRWELSNFFPPWLFDYTKKGKGVETNLKMGCCCWRWGKAALKRCFWWIILGAREGIPIGFGGCGWNFSCTHKENVDLVDFRFPWIPPSFRSEFKSQSGGRPITLQPSFGSYLW